MGDKDTIDLFGHCSLGEQAETKHNDANNELKKHPNGCFFDVLKIKINALRTVVLYEPS